MNDDRIQMTERQAHALATFINAIRPDWQAPGIVPALAQARQRGTAADVAVAAIRAAADPAIRTPAVIALDGRHWHQPALDETPPTSTPPSAQSMTCDRCGFFAVPGEDHACETRATLDQVRLRAAEAKAEIRAYTPPVAAKADDAPDAQRQHTIELSRAMQERPDGTPPQPGRSTRRGADVHPPTASDAADSGPDLGLDPGPDSNAVSVAVPA